MVSAPRLTPASLRSKLFADDDMSRLAKSFQNHICFILLMFLAGIADKGHADPIAVSAKVDKYQVTIGDIITYTLTVQHDPDMEITPPAVKFKGFDVVESGKSSINRQEEYWYRLRADQTGSITLDPVKVAFKSPDLGSPTGKIEGQALTPKIDVEVKSVLHLQGDPKDIRDIKSIIPIARDGSEYYKYGFIALIVIALSLLLWRKLKQKKAFLPAPQHILSPHEQALLELEALQSRQLLEQGKIQEHYFELSEIFRRYLGDRYGFPSLDWTTEEIHSKLAELHELNNLLREQAISILKRTDRIKFAKACVDTATSGEILKSVVQFIHATTKMPEPTQSTSIPK